MVNVTLFPSPSLLGFCVQQASGCAIVTFSVFPTSKLRCKPECAGDKCRSLVHDEFHSKRPLRLWNCNWALTTWKCKARRGGKREKKKKKSSKCRFGSKKPVVIFWKIKINNWSVFALAKKKNGLTLSLLFSPIYKLCLFLGAFTACAVRPRALHGSVVSSLCRRA